MMIAPVTTNKFSMTRSSTAGFTSLVPRMTSSHLKMYQESFSNMIIHKRRRRNPKRTMIEMNTTLFENIDFIVLGFWGFGET